ncbi:MAG TPA: hypothetical protein VFV38_31190 [Ktedonobacteraceae bacterium]|nr:hypothetical protein [Ktedonobacteraceae bacterium]
MASYRSSRPPAREKGSVCAAPRRRTRLRFSRRSLFWSAFLPFIILGTVLINWVFLAQMVFAAPAASYSAPGQNTIQQFLRQGQQSKANQGQYHRLIAAPKTFAPQPGAKANASTTGKHLPSAEPAKMKDQTYQLDDSFVLHRPVTKASKATPKVQGVAIPAGNTPLIFKGSDSRLEIDLPRGSLDFSHATLADGGTPVGQFFLQIHQISGHYIAADSILGTYQIQIIDSQGRVVQGIVLTHPVTIVYHYQSWEMQDLNLNPNEIMLSWPRQIVAAQQAKHSTAGMVAPMTNNASADTLTAQSSVMSGPLTVSGSPEIATPVKPDLYETSSNSGQYSYSYPLTVTPGPGGFTPQLQLSYSSQSTNERYSRRAPAGDEGEGFSLSLGSITSSQYPSNSAGGTATWYSLNGVDGISDKLIPIPGQSGFYETQHISHLSIQFTGTFWRIYGKDGTFYELGYTADSRQTTSAGTYEWDLDKMIAPHPSNSQYKVILISYLQDSPSSGVVRDAGMKQIQYGFSTDSNTLSLVTGTVDFHYHVPTVPSGQSAFATAYGNNYNCASAPPSTTSLRCDDPTQYGTIAPPDVMSTMSLDSVTSYVGTDSTGNLSYKYAFTYQDQPFTTSYWDPNDYVQKSAAGEHLLTSITPTVYLNGTAHQRKSIEFGYSGQLRDGYNDPTHTVTGNHDWSGQTFWQYLNFYEDLSDGTGARISYNTAYANMHGTPDATDSQGNIIDDRFDPFFCDNFPNSCTGVYSLNDDYAWSLQVVTQISALGTDGSGNTTVATTQYYYGLPSISSSNTPVSSCNPVTGSGVPSWEADCVGDTWVPETSSGSKDGDWADYYHAEFRGFDNVQIISPSNDLTINYYIATAGWWTPESWSANYNSGQLFQEDVYQGTSQASGTWLSDMYRNYPGNSNGPSPK